MKVSKIQNGIITRKLSESKTFYQKWFGLEVKFETDWFLLLHLPENPDREIAFMLPGVAAVRKNYFQEEYSGKGIWLIFESEDVRSLYEEMKKKGAPMDLPLTEEEWGDVHFTLVDPNGIGIDVVQLRS